MTNPDNRPIDNLVFDCCRELFSAYGLEVQPRGRNEFPSPEQLVHCGVMGFGGRELRGALVLAATREPLEHTNPGAATLQGDWMCELANQLMGRVKNRLLTLGVEIHLATPAGLSGENLAPSPAMLRSPQVFAAANGFVCVWIDCEMAEGFELPTAISPEAEAPMLEGDALLF